MPRLARFLALLLITAVAARADDSLAHARLAQARLGSEVWSRVIRIENRARVSPYPRVMFALVFELADILWFYTDVDGTQSFSLHQNRLAEEKADFGPLLRDIEPGFGRWRDAAPEELRGPIDRRAKLPNDCFIASVAALRALHDAGAACARPRLLLFYKFAAVGALGHAVLTYLRPDGVAVLDPAADRGPRVFSAALGADALELARALGGGSVGKARWVSAELPDAPHGTVRPAVGAAAE